MSSTIVPLMIVIAILILFLGLPLWLSYFFRKRYPRRVWIGLLMAFFFVPIGQLYLEGALWYIIGLFVAFSLVKAYTGSEGVAWILTMFLSAMVMYYRLLKAKPPDLPVTEKDVL